MISTQDTETILTTVYDNDGESYGVVVKFDWDLGINSYIVSNIRWHYIASVNPVSDSVMDDIKDGIIEHFPHKGHIDFEL